MLNQQISQIIAAELTVQPQQILAAIQLLDDGNTIPFIARYRKEVTGGLDDTQLRHFETRLIYLRELEDRRQTILKSIEEQGKLTDELRDKIHATQSKTELEDLYLPYKPKRRTKGQIAIEAGLEPLADLLWNEPKNDPETSAAEFVNDGMVVGLGTGSTAYYFVEEIGRRIKEEGLQITAVTTSSVTSKQAEGLNIPLKSIDQVDVVDVTVDGADEVDSQFNGIKGGGGALLMEKVVATPSKEYIWVVDESKLVEKLGAFKLPVEVVQYGAEQVFRRFERAGYKPSFREKDGQRFVTDMQNFIIDLALDVIEDPIAFGQELDHVVGVVEHGLFNQMVDKVIVAGRDGVQILTSTKAR